LSFFFCYLFIYLFIYFSCFLVFQYKISQWIALCLQQQTVCLTNVSLSLSLSLSLQFSKWSLLNVFLFVEGSFNEDVKLRSCSGMKQAKSSLGTSGFLPLQKIKGAAAASALTRRGPHGVPHRPRIANN
jgi:hypothetical protein